MKNRTIFLMRIKFNPKSCFGFEDWRYFYKNLGNIFCQWLIRWVWILVLLVSSIRLYILTGIDRQLDKKDTKKKEIDLYNLFSFIEHEMNKTRKFLIRYSIN